MIRRFFSRRIVFVLAAIILGGMMEPSSAFQADAKIDGREADRLFQDLGVFNIPRILPPVDFELMDLNNRKVRLSDLKGKIVFLNFWASWCYPCRIEMPSMERLHRRFKDKDFVIVAINLQEPASRVKEFFKENNLTFITLLDSTGEVGARFGISSLPTTFIMDKEGRIIGGALGAREWDTKEAIALFEYLIEKDQ